MNGTQMNKVKMSGV